MAAYPKPAVKTMKLSHIVELDEQSLEKLYCWVDEIPLSRTKKNLSRDFADGVLAAEIVRYQIPKLVDMHNYNAASSVENKITNWTLLNRKVLQKLDLEVDPEVIRLIVQSRPWAIENFLIMLRDQMDMYLMLRGGSRVDITYQGMPANQKDFSDEPEVDQVSLMRGHHALQYFGVLPALSLNQAYPGSLTQPSQHKKSPPGTNRLLGPPGKPFLSPRNKYGQEVVPKAMFQEKQQELQMKEETIQILKAKISGLEKLISLKDIRIDDLTARIRALEEYRPTVTGQMRKAQSQRHVNEAGLQGRGRGRVF